MTDLVQNLKIGNSAYTIQDGNTLPALTATQRTTLLSNGTYLGNIVDNNKIFETASGKFESFTDTVTGSSITWSNGTLTQTYYWSNNAAYGDGTFVMVSNGGSVYGTYSTNGGTTWKAATMPSGVTGQWRSVAYGNGIFVAVPNSSTNALYSTDGGKTWQASTMPDSRYNSVAYGNGRFVATPEQNRITGAYSDDGGVTWTSMNMKSAGYWYNVIYGGNRFVAVAYIGNKASYSTDGLSWTDSTLPSATTWDMIAYGNGRYVVSSLNQQICTYSTDGSTWSQAITPPVRFSSLVFDSGVFIATQWQSNAVYTSTDGETWTQATSLPSGTWYMCTGGGGRFLAKKDYNTNTVASGVYTVTHEYSLTPLSYTAAEVDSKGYLQNTATGTNITINGIATTSSIAYGNINIGPNSKITVASTQVQGGIAIGQMSEVSVSNAVALGRLAKATGSASLAIGLNARSTAEEAYQIGRGTNANSRTLQVGFWNPDADRDVQYQLLDSSGKVPVERYIPLTGATASTAGTLGVVPAPAAGDNTKFLRGDGTWAEAGGGGSASYKGVNTQSMAGTTDPTSSTEASIGTLYVNTTTSTPFICVNNVMTPTYTLDTVSTGYATVTNGILTASSGWATVSIPQIPSNSTISYVTKVKIKSSASSLTSGRNLLNIGDNSNNSFGLYLLSSGVFALSSQVNGSWNQHNSTVAPIVGSYMWLAFSIDSNGSVTSSVSLDGESWQQLCSPFTFSSASGYTAYVVGDMGNIESGWETDTDLNATHLYVNGVEEKLYNISNVSWSELYDSSVVQTLPVSPTAGKIYFVTGSTT